MAYTRHVLMECVRRQVPCPSVLTQPLCMPAPCGLMTMEYGHLRSHLAASPRCVGSTLDAFMADESIDVILHVYGRKAELFSRHYKDLSTKVLHIDAHYEKDPESDVELREVNRDEARGRRKKKKKAFPKTAKLA